ncbi:TNF receptor-associated factor 4-like isoform X1 [Biomphalaria glabrata]|uniref:TNF receptor-associated factor 4-like isoform X1 n=2 Tax=Biomphalaria glabrata TaxID=6526 RepID=A0A9W2YG54_BIOGL|nr:TNF receptor-associated factor 4-like isoform X1 [Biomphalaria glabrata]XP_055861702.1 TNF receptor-associated factor 4-like isoform X1 [Biomphalaria glabrata]
MPGYSFTFVDKLRKRCYCPLCHLPMRDPVLVRTCGHRFCDVCLQEYLSGGIFHCPEDDKPLDYAKLYPDSEVHNEIMNSIIRCTYQKDGCRWIDKLQNLPNHLQACRFDAISCPNNCTAHLTKANIDDHLEYLCPKRTVVCDFCQQEFSGQIMDETHAGNCFKEVIWCENKCGAKLERRFLMNHMKNDCHKRTVTCQYCSKDFLQETLQTHQYQCPRFPVTCPNRCDPAKIPREDIENHVHESCPSATIACPFKDAGCRYKCPRYSLELHMEEGVRKHLELTCDLLKQQQAQIAQLCSTLQAIAQTTDGIFIWKISNYKSKLNEAVHKSNKELISPPFYTSRFGYKACLSVFLNGNGAGEGKYISVYIKLLHGDYNNILDWPFVLPVSFTLFDQNIDATMRMNISESFIPDPAWKHFQKPCQSTESLGFGYPKFVSHEIIRSRDYIKDDALILKVTIDNAQFTN